ncbi:siderophore-interacting protein [Propioniciclava soli]|uniref:Siderophore-interacting protein n=1 Tax=Propioniciclava soli TaxID=2775081 RepID=A0ABZ3C7D8_9ACTN|nr:siderophore-interacting protein [Propioniciclava soli]
MSSSRPYEAFAITTRALEVLRIADVTSGMRRVTLGGPALAAHTAPNGMPVAAFRSDGFDDEFKIILKHPDAAEPVVPTQADGHLDWPRGDPHLVMRTYTVRRWDAEAGEIDVDFVQHGVGPATTWARRVRPGETVHIAGPKSSSPHPEGVDWVLIAGDETALPAIGRWLEEWPTGARAQVFIEIAEDEHRQELPVPDGVEVTWLSRGGAEAGSTTLLLDAVARAPWWEGRVFAWVAGEALTLTPIRRWLRTERGLDRSQVEVTGYWRRQETAGPDADPGRPEPEEASPANRFHELIDLMPAVALRVAASLRVGTTLGAGSRTVAELADACGASEVGLGKLLRYLAALDVVRADAGRWSLTDLGRELDDEETEEDLALTGPAARDLAAAVSLLPAVLGRPDRWDDAAARRLFGADAAARATELEIDADTARYVASPIGTAEALRDAACVEISGRGAGSFAEAIVRAREGVEVTVVAAASDVPTLERIHGGHPRVRFAPGAVSEAGPSVDAVLLVDVLGELPDADAAHTLARAAERLSPGGVLLLLCDPLDEDRADDHDLEQDLVGFALHGAGARTHDEILALFGAAGLPEPQRTTVGWGDALYVARP